VNPSFTLSPRGGGVGVGVGVGGKASTHAAKRLSNKIRITGVVIFFIICLLSEWLHAKITKANPLLI
jgi:hypothetical protein